MLIMGALAGIGLCSAPDPGDPGGGGGGGGGGDKTFTQDQVNAIVADSRKKYEAQINELKPLAEKAKSIDDLQAQITKLTEEKELVGKTEAEKARIEADKAAKRIADERAAAAKERDEEKGKREAAEGRLRNVHVKYALTTALTAAKAFPEALDDAVGAMMASSKVEVDDDGKVTAVIFGGVTHTDTKAAAEAFLKTKPYFAQGVAGGAGTRNPNGGIRPADLQSMSSDQLISAGLAEKP